jgi:hypothetical protein
MAGREDLRMSHIAFLAPRRCLLEPIPEIWIAARLMQDAVIAHLSGKTHRAEALFSEADIPAITDWTESIWGKRTRQIHRLRSVQNCLSFLDKKCGPSLGCRPSKRGSR